ncbi:T9SS type A sorting domain-containing protein [Paraflavitalea sp. CAU 1676]|uniref:T9SS type A sorting domain-containing protein n=1 Tax=Paraflavitalea sp. CAU 1676 TaxID=3032598 RepID=UPI0023DC00B1|nr:T9SS type A sorting domain-containing protein [Paraflavitalea sp. CAU 1676]MDF2189200.1 T9SS type A sorting domain-containing protein [Paraflavitalea sp. CAU 1676]
MRPSVPHQPRQRAQTISVAFPDAFLRRRVLITLLLLTAFYIAVNAQSVTEVITDYGGYWKSGQSAISTTRPDNSHNMLAFQFNGTRYSTGVNDALLTTRGDHFTAGDYKALPVYQSTGSSSDTKIGLGASYDGVANGASNPRPVNSINKYLTDGVKGLDLGTCVANLPAGDLMFAVTNMQAQLVGDGIPDLLITQTADPSGAQDRYEFVDINGNRVGNSVNINLSSLPVVGNWTADFYDVNSNPMSLASGFTQTDRPIRLWAADFSTFGINATNIGQIVYFRIRLNGNSDVAFVAYNNKTFSLNSTLPTKLAYFTAKAAGQQVKLNWQSVTETQLARFAVEASYDGRQFHTLDSVKATGNSTTPNNYAFIHRNAPNGKIWYRLKQIDIDGRYEYSALAQVNNVNEHYTALRAYPNPATNRVIVSHEPATGKEQCAIHSMNGTVMVQAKPAAGSVQTTFDVQSLPTGTYLLVMTNGQAQNTTMLLKK